MQDTAERDNQEQFTAVWTERESTGHKEGAGRNLVPASFTLFSGDI